MGHQFNSDLTTPLPIKVETHPKTLKPIRDSSNQQAKMFNNQQHPFFSSLPDFGFSFILKGEGSFPSRFWVEGWGSECFVVLSVDLAVLSSGVLSVAFEYISECSEIYL